MTSQVLDRVDILSRRFLAPDARPLTEPELKWAKKNLLEYPYRSLVRVKQDPQIRGQKYGLISFTPSVHAQPDARGIYGVMKIRGNYNNLEAAESAAEDLVREVDSANPILICKVGQDFPITAERRFVEESVDIDLSKQVQDVKDEQADKQRRARERELKTVKEREKQLLQESKEAQADVPLDPYLRYKMRLGAKAHMLYSINRTEKLLAEYRQSLEAATRELAEMEAEHPDWYENARADILEARREVGIEDNFQFEGDGEFINYL